MIKIFPSRFQIQGKSKETPSRSSILNIIFKKVFCQKKRKILTIQMKNFARIKGRGALYLTYF